MILDPALGTAKFSFKDYTGPRHGGEDGFPHYFHHIGIIRVYSIQSSQHFETIQTIGHVSSCSSDTTPNTLEMHTECEWKAHQ